MNNNTRLMKSKTYSTGKILVKCCNMFEEYLNKYLKHFDFFNLKNTSNKRNEKQSTY